MTYTEDNMQRALRKFNQGGHSLRGVAHEFGIRVPLSATDLMVTGPAPWPSNGFRFSPGPRKSAFAKFAGRILKTQGDSRVVGKNWINRFMARHSIVLSAKARKADEVDAGHDKGAFVEEDEPQTSGSEDTSCIVVRSKRR
ncbi:hypothetical protein F5144DRAFT_606631 [Chaetomium tenue]|uniref:Uncharacterized protein n=1 Tax=Chaetomium tenue TaxID=1854479 RepID=A0ACB7NUW4_9PEZI|nr:hypothetical protein F5144DRAFT_606631 [Chaetomium globosum]